jgi:hypothetical protein
MDVVPVDPDTEDEWQQEPFGGRISDGYIWGRGAIDNKSTVLGTLEAVEMLLADGFRPTRTVYLAYGHDEEVGGTNGARAIAALLESRGVALDMVLDEGGVIGDGVLPGISAPVALVGIAEKGFRDVEVERSGTGGPLVAATPSGRGRHRECGHRETGREPHAGAPRGSDAGTVQPNRTPVPHGATGRPRQSLAHATSCGSTATPRRHFPPLSPPPGGCHRRERHQKLQ